MKKIVLILFLMAVNLGILSARTEGRHPASSPEIRWEGRTVAAEDGSVSFNWTGVYMTFRFMGTKASMTVSDSGKNYFDLYVDGKYSKQVATFGKDSTVVLFRGLQGTHSVLLRRRTEGSLGVTTVSAIDIELNKTVIEKVGKKKFVEKDTTMAGKLLAPDAPKRRRIEVIGDSFTCGYGTESTDGSDPFTAETENCGKAYGCLVADYFGAEYTLVAHSGRGVVRNYGDTLLASTEGTMPQMYGYALDDRADTKWKTPRGASPDIVLIYLGENDFSTGMQPEKEVFINAYRSLISQVRDAYGDVPILCIAPFASEDLRMYVHEAASFLPEVYYTAIFKNAYNRTTDLGASEHPNYLGQRKLSLLLLPYISTITGWSLKH